MKINSMTYNRYRDEYFATRLKEGENPHTIPKIKKISISTSNLLIGKSKEQYDIVFNVFKKISLQKPVSSYAKHSIAQFKIRKGNVIGIHATLRKENMWSFLDRLIYVNLPRVRQFKGLSLKAFSNNGGYNLGIIDHSVFYEIYTEKQTKPFGFNISLDTTATTSESCKSLLSSIGMAFLEDK